MEWITWFLTNWILILGAVTSLLGAAIAVCMLIPGTKKHIIVMRKILDFLTKINRK